MERAAEGAQGEALEIIKTLAGQDAPELEWDGPDLLVKLPDQEQPILVGRDGSIMWGE